MKGKGKKFWHSALKSAKIDLMNTAKSLQPYEISLPMGNIETYASRVYQIPVLTLEEEQELTRRWYEEQDLQAARQLVLAHLRFVVKVARGYMGYGLALGDLIQEGNIGLMKAVRRFEPQHGVRLVSFAVHWIKAEIHEFILRNWRIVKVATTKAQRKLFFNLRKMKKRLGWFTQEEVQSVADDLGVTAKEVLQMESRLNARDAAFDGYDSDDSSASNAPENFAPAQYLEDHSQDPARVLENQDWSTHGRDKLYQALEGLDKRSRDILTSRWLSDEKPTLHDLAARYSISAERVRQLEQNAMRKLKEFIQ